MKICFSLKVSLITLIVSTIPIFSANEVSAQFLIGSSAVRDILEPANAGNFADAGTFGWSFTVERTTDYHALGYWDEDADGLIGSPRVGLWDSSGSLLASTNIPSGTSSIALLETTGINGIFRWVPIGTVTLNPGETYYLGAQSALDNFVFDGNAVFDSNVNFDASRNSLSSDGGIEDFSFPQYAEGGTGRFGPNIAQIVPEPITILGSVAAFGFCNILRCKQKNK